MNAANDHPSVQNAKNTVMNGKQLGLATQTQMLNPSHTTHC